MTSKEEPQKVEAQIVVKATANLEDEVSEEIKKEDKALSELLRKKVEDDYKNDTLDNRSSG